jgi:hypothetical protein
LSTSKAAATETVASSITSGAGNNCLAFQLISGPLEAQTITGGTVTVIARARELATQDNVNKRWRKVYVVSNDGSTVRGTLVTMAATTSTTELPTALGGKVMAVTAGTGTLAVLAGDRIVVEIGFGLSATGTTPQTETVIGGNGTDHTTTEGDTSGTVPWVEFSQTLTFEPDITEHQGSADLSASAQLAVSAVRSAVAEGTLTAAAVLAVSATLTRPADAALAADATLGPTADVTRLGSAALVADAVLSATARATAAPVVEIANGYIVGGGGATSIGPVSPPAEAIAGKRLVAVVSWRAQGAITPSEAGWSERHDLSVTNGPATAVYERLIDAADPSAYTFTFSGSAARCTVMFFVVLNSSSIEDSQQNSGSAATTLVAPSATSLGLNRLLVSVWSRTHDEAWIGYPPAGMTYLFEVSSGGAAAGITWQGSAWEEVGSGATGTRSVSLSVGRNYEAFSIIFAPPVTTGDVTGSADLVASASLSTTAVRSAVASADLAASASLSTTAVVTRPAAADLAASASLSTTAVLTRLGSATLVAVAVLTADATSGVTGSAQLTAAAVLSAVGLRTQLASVAMSAQAALVSTVTVVRVASAGLSGSATLTATAVLTRIGASQLVAAATLTTSAIIAGQNSAQLTADAVLTATALRIAVAGVALAAAASLATTGTAVRVGGAALLGSGTLSAVAVVSRLAAVQLVSGATLSATGTRVTIGSVVLAAVASLLVEPAGAAVGAAALVAAAILSTSGRVRTPGLVGVLSGSFRATGGPRGTFRPGSSITMRTRKGGPQ